MAKVKLAGNPVNTKGELPPKGKKAPKAKLVKNNLQETTLDDFKGKKIVMNVFPSLDTSTCATSVRKFNTLANEMDNTVVLAISKDLPFAMERFCTTEGLENVIPLSAFRSPEFGSDYGMEIVDGPLAGLLSRSIIVIDENGDVIYEELVPEITEEPNYTAVLEVLS